VIELVNIYLVWSCSFVEIMRLCCFGLYYLSYGIVGITWRSFVLSYLLVAAYCVTRAKPCRPMLCFVMRRPACWSWFFELGLHCTRRLLRFVNDCNKGDYYYYDMYTKYG